MRAMAFLPASVCSTFSWERAWVTARPMNRALKGMNLCMRMPPVLGAILMAGCRKGVEFPERSAPAAKRAFTAGQDQLAVEHAFRGEEFVAQVVHLCGRSAQHGHFQAVPLAQMHVHAGND